MANKLIIFMTLLHFSRFALYPNTIPAMPADTSNRLSSAIVKGNVIRPNWIDRDAFRRSAALLGRQQLLHIVEGRRRGPRQSRDAARHVVGADRADIDAELGGFREKTRVAVGGEKSRLQRLGAIRRTAGRITEG